MKKVVDKRGKRVGRGYGSGKGGHTSGRGQKGQKARRSIGVLFEGVKIKKSLIKRLPLMRGKGRNAPGKKPIIVKVAYLDLLPQGTTVNLEVLVKYKIVKEKDAREFGVKILGGGKISKKLTIMLPISKNAAKDVEKVGGKILTEEQNSKSKK